MKSPFLFSLLFLCIQLGAFAHVKELDKEQTITNPASDVAYALKAYAGWQEVVRA